MPLPVAVVTFAGELSISRYPDIHASFEACPKDARRVLVDLTDVRYVDSTFLTELLLFSKHLGDLGASCVIAAGPAITKILGVTRIDLRMRVFPTVDAAMKHLGHIIPVESSEREPNGAGSQVPAE